MQEERDQAIPRVSIQLGVRILCNTLLQFSLNISILTLYIIRKLHGLNVHGFLLTLTLLYKNSF